MAITPLSPQIPRPGSFGIVLVAALLGGILAAVTLRDGIWISPDGWGYWQGAVSILEEHRYKLFLFDEPIECWPPLYSLYLAAWQSLLGISGQTLVTSTIALVAATSAAWTWLWFQQLGESVPEKSRRVIGLVVALLAAEYWAHQDRALLSENLRNLLLPFFLGNLCKLCPGEIDAPHVCPSLLAGIVGVLLLLTHNSCVAIVAAGLLTLGLARGPGWSLRLQRVLLIGAVAIFPAIASKLLLHQFGSHPIGFGFGRFSLSHYALAVLDYLPAGVFATSQPLVALFWLGGLALAAWRLVAPNSFPRLAPALRATVAFVAFFLAVMILIFANAWISDDLTGRYLNFVPWILFSLLLGACTRLEWHSWGIALAALSLVFVTDRLVRFEWLRRNMPAGHSHETFVRKEITIAHRFATGNPQPQGKQTLVAPPLYPWLKERLDARATGQLPPHLTKGNPAYRNLGW